MNERFSLTIEQCYKLEEVAPECFRIKKHTSGIEFIDFNGISIALNRENRDEWALAKIDMAFHSIVLHLYQSLPEYLILPLKVEDKVMYTCTSRDGKLGVIREQLTIAIYDAYIQYKESILQLQ